MNVSATAIAQQATVLVWSEAERKRLIARRNFVLPLEGNKANEELLADAVHAAREGRYQDASIKFEITDWRFVEFIEVPRGPWSTHGQNNTFLINDRQKGKALVERLGTIAH